MTIFEYINGFYNPRRRHSALGPKAPSLSNGKGLERAPGAAQNRDRTRGQIRKLEADTIAARRISGWSPDATDEVREGYHYVLEGQLDAAAYTGKEREALASSALVFKGAVLLARVLRENAWMPSLRAI